MWCCIILGGLSWPQQLITWDDTAFTSFSFVWTGFRSWLRPVRVHGHRKILSHLRRFQHERTSQPRKLRRQDQERGISGLGWPPQDAKLARDFLLKKVLGRPKLIKMANIGHDWTLNPKTPILWTLICDCSNPYKFCFYCSATHVTSQVLHPKSVPTQTV